MSNIFTVYGSTPLTNSLIMEEKIESREKKKKKLSTKKERAVP